MPEGDTIEKLARFLDAALAGQNVSSIRLHPAFGPSIAGNRVHRVSAHGKHLYIDLADGNTLRSHLGMYGSWHRYRRDERWRRPERQASIVIGAAHWSYVCFNAKEVEWLRAGGFQLVDQRHRLGSSLTEDVGDAEEILARARRLLAPTTLLVDVLLDQRLAAGIGNVYKSELLFLERRWPLAQLAEISDDALATLYRRAAELLQANLGGGVRTTRFDRDRRGKLWVYGRRGLPCLRCGELVRRAVVGAAPRSTYWCEGCQRPS